MCDSGLGRVRGILPLTAADTAGLAPKYVPKPLSKGMGNRGTSVFSPLPSRTLILGALGKFGLLPFLKQVPHFIAGALGHSVSQPSIAALSLGMAPRHVLAVLHKTPCARETRGARRIPGRGGQRGSALQAACRPPAAARQALSLRDITAVPRPQSSRAQ